MSRYYFIPRTSSIHNLIPPPPGVGHPEDPNGPPPQPPTQVKADTFLLAGVLVDPAGMPLDLAALEADVRMRLVGEGFPPEGQQYTAQRTGNPGEVRFYVPAPFLVMGPSSALIYLTVQHSGPSGDEFYTVVRHEALVLEDVGYSRS